MTTSQIQKCIPPILALSCISHILLKKFQTYNLNTYKIEFDQTTKNINLDMIKQHIITKHNIKSITTKNNTLLIETTVYETHESTNFTIEITHTSLTITLASKHIKALDLSLIYQRWLHNIIKEYETTTKNYILINKDFINLDTFMIKYIYHVNPSFATLYILSHRSKLAQDFPLLFKTQEYAIVDNHPHTNTSTSIYGNHRFIETYEGIDIFIEINDTTIWLYYIVPHDHDHNHNHNHNHNNPKQIIIQRILSLISQKNETYIINTHDPDSKNNKQLVPKNIQMFLQPITTSQHNLIMRRINKMQTRDLTIGFGIFLHGPPGNGKSTYAKYLALLTQRDINLLNLSRLSNADQLFQIIYDISTTQSILLIEDLDRTWNSKIINTHDDIHMEHIDKKIGLDAILSAIDLAISCGTIIIITANTIPFDEAVTRNGRFDYIIEMKNCDELQKSQIINHFFGDCAPEYPMPFIEHSQSVANVFTCVQNMYLCS